MNGIFVLATGALAWFLFSRYQTVKSLVFSPGGASFDFSNPTAPVIQIKVVVQNPTQNAIILNSIAANITINGTFAGNLSDFIQQTIAPNSQTTIALNFRPSIAGVVSDIMNLLSSSSEIDGNISGTASVDSTTIPINFNFSGAQNLLAI